MSQDWIDKRDRLPTREDANHRGGVLAWWKEFDVPMIDHWSNVCTNKNIIAWAKLPGSFCEVGLIP